MSLIEISCFSSGLCRKLPCDEYSCEVWLSFHANLPHKLNFGSKISNNFKQAKQISRYQPNLKRNFINKLCLLVCVLLCAKICSGLKAQIWSLCVENLVENFFLCVLKKRKFISFIGAIDTLNLMQLSLKFAFKI